MCKHLAVERADLLRLPGAGYEKEDTGEARRARLSRGRERRGRG